MTCPFTHFYSDPHYGHANIIKYANRPFDSVAEMDEELERRYAWDIWSDSHVLWLGDCFWGKDWAKWKALLARLPGRKSVVKGNHDPSPERLLELGFEAVYDRVQFEVAGGVPVLACHYPPKASRYAGQKFDGRHDAKRPEVPAGGIVMHGHTHEKLRVTLDRVHAGVDAWDYRPASLQEIEQLLPWAIELPWDKPVKNLGESDGNP